MVIVAVLAVILACLWCLFPGTRQLPGPPPERCTRTSNDPQALELAAVLESRALQLVQHLKARYTTHPITRDLIARWNGRILPSREFANPNVKASFNKSTGCLYMRLDETRTTEQWLGILLHELAHASGNSHDEAFRKAWMFLLNVATRDLGWGVALHCQNACSSYLLCAPQDCELCSCS